MGIGSFPGVKRTWLWPLTPPSAEVKERVELYIYSPSGPSWPVVGWNLPYFTFTLHVSVVFDRHRTIFIIRWWSKTTETGTYTKIKMDVKRFALKRSAYLRVVLRLQINIKCSEICQVDHLHKVTTYRCWTHIGRTGEALYILHIRPPP